MAWSLLKLTILLPVVKSCVYKSSINWYNVAGLIFQKFHVDYTLDNYAYSILEQIGPR